MKEATITFDQTYANEEGQAGDQVNHTEVPIQADGETVCFTLPSGARWECDQEALRALLD